MTYLRAAFFCGSLVVGGCSDEDAPLFPKSNLVDEAGFVDIEPVDYALHADFGTRSFRSSAARLFYAFQPADESPEDKPIAVFWNGGPGATTEILLALGTGRSSLDPAWNGGSIVGPNPASFTAFANTLYIDARGAGFSYGLLDDPSDAAARASEFALRNHNPWLDAADFVRVLLRFFSTHPALERSRVAFVGESYGGTRASIVLHLLMHPDMYGDGSAPYEDKALANEIRTHLEATGAAEKGAAVDPARVAAQFGTQVLLQPRLTEHQATYTGILLEAPGSVMDDIALDTGVPFVRCSDKPPPCDAYRNALDYLDAVGRDMYDMQRPSGYMFGRFDDLADKIVLPDVLGKCLGVDPTRIEGLSAASRKGAFRVVHAANASPSPLDAALGALPSWDRYFLVEVFDLMNLPFRGPEAVALSVDIPDARWGDLFLDNLRHTRTLITAASRDMVIYSPAIAPALGLHTKRVASVMEESEEPANSPRPGRIRVDYADGETRYIRFPRYDAGHVVTLDAPQEFAEDVEAFFRDE